MKSSKAVFFCFLVLMFFMNINNVFSQEFKVPKKYSFKSVEDFIKYEPDILKCIEYLENAPVNDLSKNRKNINSFFIEWISDVPYVHITVNGAVIELIKNNENLLTIFFGGWTKYTLSNRDNEVKLEGYLAGIESLLSVYKKGNGVKENSAVIELIKIQESGKLREWAMQQIK